MDTDGTEERKDEAQAKEDTSGGDKGTSEKEAPTFTEEQVAEIAKKAANDALSAAGRSAKAFEAREQAIKDAEEHLAQSTAANRAAELEAHKDEPDELIAIRKRHQEAERQDKLDKKERELKAKEETIQHDVERVTKAESKERAQVVALKHDVAAETLEKFTDGTLESMEELAKGLPKLGKAKDPLKPDSGKTIGGGSMPNNLEDFKVWAASLTQSEYESKASEIDARLKELQNQ